MPSALCFAAALSTVSAMAEFKTLPSAVLPAASPFNQAQLIRLPKPAGIPSLRVKQNKLDIHPVFRNAKPYGMVHVEGTFPDPDSSLLLSNQNEDRIPLGNSGRFSLWIPILGPTTFFILTKIGPPGEIQEEKFQIEFPQWSAWLTQTRNSRLHAIAKTPRFALTSGLGITYQTYTATYTSGTAVPLTQLGLTVKIAADYAWVPRKWTVGGNAFITALPLMHSATYPDVTLRVLGANFRVGYTFAPGVFGVKPPWSLSLAGGVYYSTTFDATGTLGYKNVGGPQIYPVLKREFRNGSAGTAYFKYSPISNGFQFLSLSSYEMAAGLGYWFPNRKKVGRLGFAVDFARLTITTTTTLVQSQSVTLGVNFGL